MKKVSIIIPCYSVEKYLDRCMESLLNQTLKDIEIIMVDDGSPDNCPKMCDGYARKDSRVKVIHKKNGGLGHARNSGLEVATGEYVAFVDSDDYVDTKMYETLYRKAKESDADAVFCGFKTEHKNNIWIDSLEVKNCTFFDTEEKIQGFILDMIACAPHVKSERKYQMSVWHSIYKHTIIKEHDIKFLSERNIVSEDIPFQIDFLKKAHNIVYLPQTFYYYCLNETSLTATYKPEKYDRYKLLRKTLLIKTEGFTGNQERINRLFIGYVRSNLLALYSTKHIAKDDIVNNIINDDIWKDIKKEYSSSYLPIHARLIYVLICNKQKMLLGVVLKFILKIKRT